MKITGVALIVSIAAECGTTTALQLYPWQVLCADARRQVVELLAMILHNGRNRLGKYFGVLF